MYKIHINTYIYDYVHVYTCTYIFTHTYLPAESQMSSESCQNIQCIDLAILESAENQKTL